MLSGGMLLCGVVGAFLFVRAEADRAEIGIELLERTRAARERVLAESAARERRDRIESKLRSEAIPRTPVSAVQSLRKSLTAAGLSDVRVDLVGNESHGALRLLRVRVAGAGDYRALRRFLVESQRQPVPAGWNALSYDGRVLEVDLHLLAREST